MTDLQGIKQGFKQGQEEFNKKLVELVKKMTLDTLNKLEELKKEKAVVEEKIRILKMDLDDLEAGKVDRIRERQEKSRTAGQVSQIDWHGLCQDCATVTTEGLQWTYTIPMNLTSGTYTTNSGTIFYL